MNLPNYITLLRIVLIPFFINFMVYGYEREAFVIFVVACITDALDGMIARLTGTQTQLGAFLDPMADKLLIISAFVTLVLLRMLPVWLVIIVVSRDVILVLGSIAIYFTGHKFIAKPSIIGKITTLLQLVTVTLSLLVRTFGTETGLMTVLQWGTAGFTLVSGVQYIARGTKLIGQNFE